MRDEFSEDVNKNRGGTGWLSLLQPKLPKIDKWPQGGFGAIFEHWCCRSYHGCFTWWTPI